MEEKKYLKWYNKIGYGSGDIAGNVVYAFLTSFMMPYLTDSVGLAAGVVGAADNENFRAIFTEEQIATLKDMEAKVASGEVSVFSAIGADDASIQALKDSVQ